MPLTPPISDLRIGSDQAVAAYLGAEPFDFGATFPWQAFVDVAEQHGATRCFVYENGAASLCRVSGQPLMSVPAWQNSIPVSPPSWRAGRAWRYDPEAPTVDWTDTVRANPLHEHPAAGKSWCYASFLWTPDADQMRSGSLSNPMEVIQARYSVGGVGGSRYSLFARQSNNYIQFALWDIPDSRVIYRYSPRLSVGGWLLVGVYVATDGEMGLRIMSFPEGGVSSWTTTDATVPTDEFGLTQRIDYRDTYFRHGSNVLWLDGPGTYAAFCSAMDDLLDSAKLYP